MSNRVALSFLRVGLCLPALALAGIATAHAQAAPPQDAGADTTSGEEIVVTGSRIRQNSAQLAEPAIAIDQRVLEDRAFTNIADLLNESPGVRGSVTPDGVQGSFGQGVNFANLMSLGTNRTLVLVNGRRMVTSNVPTTLGNASPGHQVDINTIPTILLKQTDVVLIGGAPVYGTDAIGGTINFRLDTRLNTLKLRATSGITSRGDNFRRELAAAGGTDFAGGRGNVTAAVSWEKNDGVLYNARSFYRANISATANPCTVVQAGVCTAANLVSNLGLAGRTPQNDGRVNPDIGFNDSLSDGFPGSILIKDLTIPGIAQGGVLSSGSGAYSWRFAPDGSLVAYNRGILFANSLPGNPTTARASGGDGFSFNDYNQITSNLKRLNANLFLTYDLTDALRFFAEGQFFQGDYDKLVQQPAFNGSVFSGVSGALTFRTDNPFLTQQARTQLAALGYGSTFQLSRIHDDLANLSGFARSRLYRGVAGLDGHFSLGGRAYNFEAYLNYSRNDFTDYSQAINQQHFINAVNVTKVGDQIVCSTTATVTGFPAGSLPVADAACQPLNLFGSGAPSKQALAYVLQDVEAKSRMEQFVANVNLGGSPFDLFGNPVSFNLGYEHHAEKGSFTPDAFFIAGLGRAPAVSPTKGHYNMDEVFGEVKVPVFTPANDFVFSKLELFARGRHVNNSENGNFTAWALGGVFAPIRDVELRGNFTRSFRAPSIIELTAPETSGKTTVLDLCSAANINAGPVPTIRRANCDAFLAKYPTATPLAAATIGVPYKTNSRDAAILNEIADSYTFGAVIRPRLLPGLVASIDYYNAKVKQPITSLTAAQIVQSCFDNPVFNASDPANGNIFCSYIKRDSTGQVLIDDKNGSVEIGYRNGQRITMRAVQGQLDYRTGLGALGIKGHLDLGLNVFHLIHRLVDITGVSPVRSDGLVGDPRWQGRLDLRYANKAWGVSTAVRYTGRQLVSVSNRGANPNDTREFDHYRAYALVDASAFLTPAEGFRLTFSVANLFDRTGQKYYGVVVPNSIASLSEALGRRFTVRVEKAF